MTVSLPLAAKHLPAAVQKGAVAWLLPALTVEVQVHAGSSSAPGALEAPFSKMNLLRHQSHLFSKLPSLVSLIPNFPAFDKCN